MTTMQDTEAVEMNNEKIIAEVLKEEYGSDVVDESVIRIAKKIANEARTCGRKEMATLVGGRLNNQRLLTSRKIKEVIKPKAEWVK